LTPENPFGDGLMFEDSLALAWVSCGPIEAGELARLNVDNLQLLSAESSLEEVRVQEALKNESPALVHELQRLEYKINILLRLTAEIAVRNKALPEPRRVRLAARGLEWWGSDAPVAGATGVLSLYINPTLPQALRLPARVAGEIGDGPARVVRMPFVGLSEAVSDAIEKFIFRHHRRLVAGAKQAVT
jgi:hypothetical protein